MSGDDMCTTVTSCRTVSAPSKVIVNVVNQDSSRNKVTSSESGMAVSSNMNLVPGKSSTTSGASATFVQVLPQDTVLAKILCQPCNYISTEEPVYNGHLGTRYIWPLYTGGCYRENLYKVVSSILVAMAVINE